MKGDLECKCLRLSRSKQSIWSVCLVKGEIKNGVLKIDNQEIPKSEWFRYLGSIIHNDGDIENYVNYNIKATWMKRSAHKEYCVIVEYQLS